jgi:DNA processing protein
MPDPLSSEVRDLLALTLADGLGPVRIAALLEHFGSAGRVLRARPSELTQVAGIGAQLSTKIAEALSGVHADAEIERTRAAGVQVIALGGPDYPAALAAIPVAPRILYVKGTIAPADERAVALVGTRHPTAYGRKMAKSLSEGLARAGVTIVSGLARGIDGIAHRGALDGGGRTLAVLAGGLSRLYPPEHRGLADEVAARGALVTESAMGQEPLPGLFPARNRIISGLSRIVVIVQAPTKSGALITASHAGEQGRTVLAVPGPADDEACSGCNSLIREGAVLCRSVDDVLEELDGVSAMAMRGRAAESPEPRPAGPPPGLDATQSRIYQALMDGPRSIDELAQSLDLKVAELAGTLLMLEMRKLVRRLPGSCYECRFNSG